MRLSVLAIPLLLAAAPAPDATPTRCSDVGVFAAMVAAQRVAAYDEEDAGRINAPKAAHATLRAIVRQVYELGLDPTASQIRIWTQCDDTAAETKR